MRDDRRDQSQGIGSQDRKTRVKGNRVIHTVKGALYGGDAHQPPRGLTSEQANDQRSGAKIGDRQTREAAHGERPSSEKGERHSSGEGRGRSDENTSAPFGRQQTSRNRK